MAGNDPAPGPSVTPPEKAPKPRVKNFQCTNCGAALVIRYPGLSLSVVCKSCHASIDITDPSYRVLSIMAKQAASPLIPLGTRAKLQGKEWEVIGFMTRLDDPSGFSWDEYLLFNPYYGYRWLLRQKGHWTFVETIKARPVVEGHVVKLDGTRFALFDSGHAIVTYVVGEFYWKVKTNAGVSTVDYIAPPKTLSCERDQNEKVWSIGTYIPAGEVMDAFHLGTANETGIAPNQPSPIEPTWNSIKPLWLLFGGFLTLMQLIGVATASNVEVLNWQHPFTPNAKLNDLTTPSFTVHKPTNLQLKLSAPVNNSWFYVSGELVDDQTGVTVPFERTVEYYHGYTDGESWFEGSGENQFLFSGIAPGQYHLNVDTESGAFTDVTPTVFYMRAIENVPTWSNWFWCLLLLSAVPTFYWYRNRAFEIERWSNSDFSPYVSGGSQ